MKKKFSSQKGNLFGVCSWMMGYPRNLYGKENGRFMNEPTWKLKTEIRQRHFTKLEELIIFLSPFFSYYFILFAFQFILRHVLHNTFNRTKAKKIK
jgi:hypothetical protein